MKQRDDTNKRTNEPTPAATDTQRQSRDLLIYIDTTASRTVTGEFSNKHAREDLQHILYCSAI